MSTAGESPEALEDWWADYVRSLRRRGHRRSEETVKLYSRSYERFWRWAMTRKVRTPSDVTTAVVNSRIDELRSVGPTTVAIYWRNLRPFSSWWAKEIEATNPFAGADLPSAKPQDPDVVDLDDIRALLETCKGREFADRRDNAIIRVLFDTGAAAASSSTSPSTTTGTDAATT